MNNPFKKLAVNGCFVAGLVPSRQKVHNSGGGLININGRKDQTEWVGNVPKEAQSGVFWCRK